MERSFSALALHRGLEFVIENASDVPERIFTDPERLEQVLKNLLDNAFKFTERGAVRLRFAMAEPRQDFESDALKGGGRS